MLQLLFYNALIEKMINKKGGPAMINKKALWSHACLIYFRFGLRATKQNFGNIFRGRMGAG
jgi:hypothetical protein